MYNNSYTDAVGTLDVYYCLELLIGKWSGGIYKVDFPSLSLASPLLQTGVSVKHQNPSGSIFLGLQGWKFAWHCL